MILKNFLGMNTKKRKLPPQFAREIQDLVSKRGLTRTRPGFGKYNVLAQSGSILGIFDYRRKNGQMGFLFPDANGDIYEWEQFHFGSGWVWNPLLWNPILNEWGDWEWAEGAESRWWTVMYEANELPSNADPVWRAGDETNCSVSDGILSIKGVEDEELRYEMKDAAASNSIGTIVEARMKGIVYAGSVKFQKVKIQDGTKQAFFRIWENKVEFQPGYEDLVYEMDTTDDFHIYRLTLKGNVTKLYVDGVLRLTGVGIDNINNYIEFGNDQTGTWQNESQWDYVRYYTGGF